MTKEKKVDNIRKSAYNINTFIIGYYIRTDKNNKEVKQMAKKVISLVSVVALLLCSLSAAVFAAEASEIKEPEYGTTEEEGVAVVCDKRGDVDDNGNIAPADARYALRKAVGFTDEEVAETIKRADYDNNDKFTPADARAILRVAVGLDGQAGHDFVEGTKAATWTKKGFDGKYCAFCGKTEEGVELETRIEAMIDDANDWAEEAGVAGLIKGEADGEDVALVIDVDGIWAYEGYNAAAFDGFLTKIGEYVKENIGTDADIALEGKEVYKDGKLLNTAVKEILFSVGDGFFYKIANLDADGVYGVYDITVGDEAVALTVKFIGEDANIAKVQSFAEVISNHIYAIPGTDLVIGVNAPDALVNKITNAGGKEKLETVTIAQGFGILANTDIENVIGSQVSAVNKLCKLLCGIDGFINKVYSKFSDVTVTTAEGTEIALFADEASFAPATDDFAGFVAAVADMFSEEINETTVGSFKFVEDTDNEFGTGYYEVPVSFKVNVGNADLMTNGMIEETVIVRIHVG